MLSNLRAIIAQAYRGGRSREAAGKFFSSVPGSSKESMGAGGRVVAGGLKSSLETPTKSSGVGLFSCTMIGYACYVGLEVVAARKRRAESSQRREEELELISKAKRDMRRTHLDE